MMSHTTCEHPSTPSARAKCRRANGVRSTSDATPRALRQKKEDEEERPADRSRCCNVCRLRKIEWRGTDLETGRLLDTCTKCMYHIQFSDDLVDVEV